VLSNNAMPFYETNSSLMLVSVLHCVINIKPADSLKNVEDVVIMTRTNL